MLPDSGGKPGTVIFTCTTFLSKPGRLSKFVSVMQSILDQHTARELAQIDKFLVINEFDPDCQEDFSARITSRFPLIEFIQKDSHSRGQARSLNAILERIKPYEYWIQWEETWECTA